MTLMHLKVKIKIFKLKKMNKFKMKSRIIDIKFVKTNSVILFTLIEFNTIEIKNKYIFSLKVNKINFIDLN